MKKILFISLTGMTEPLGRSQVLEYLVDLRKKNKIYLLSFERQVDLEKLNEIKILTDQHGIEWKHFIYSNRYGVFSTVYQILKAVRFSSKWIIQHNIMIVHARSMIPAVIGLWLKKRHSVKLLFDIRGFAIDEKIDSGRLKKGSILFKVLKKMDDHLYSAADHIVTLTHSAKNILHNNLNISEKKITVIPTCASREVFRIMTADETKKFKESLGYAQDDKVIIHTGTVSGWYDFSSEVLLIKEMMRQDSRLHFLILNKNEHCFIHEHINKYGLVSNKVQVASCSFDNMYKYLSVADASLFFIHSSYSKQASAPTKFAENVACHLPSITNGNVGDMSYYLEMYNVGYLVDYPMHNEDLKKIGNKVLKSISQNKHTQLDFVSLFNEHFDKNIAIEKYQNIYNELVNDSF